MLHCVYHPTEEMRVVEDDEKAKLLATGVWFGHPNEAKDMREKYEHQITSEAKPKDGKRR